MLIDQHFQPAPFRTWLLSLAPFSLAWYDSEAASLQLLPFEPLTGTQREKIRRRSAAAIHQPRLNVQTAAAPIPNEWMLFSDLEGLRLFILHTIPPVFVSAMDPQTLGILSPIADIPAMTADDQARWLPAAFEAATLLLKHSQDTLGKAADALITTTEH